MLVSHVALGVYQTNGWLVTVHAPLCLSLATSKAMTPRGLDYHDHEKEDHDPEKPCPTNKNETELLACTLSEDVDWGSSGLRQPRKLIVKVGIPFTSKKLSL